MAWGKLNEWSFRNGNECFSKLCGAEVEAKNEGKMKARALRGTSGLRLNGTGMVALTASTWENQYFMFYALQPLMGGGEIEELFWGKFAAALKNRP